MFSPQQDQLQETLHVLHPLVSVLQFKRLVRKQLPVYVAYICESFQDSTTSETSLPEVQSLLQEYADVLPT